MASLGYFLVVESFSIDQSTNRVSLFNVLEYVGSPQFPTEPYQLVAVSSWNMRPEESQQPLRIALRVHAPGEGDEHTEYPMLLEPGETPRRRSFIGIRAFRFYRVGEWRFEILLDGEHRADHVITVVQAEATPDQAPG